MCEITNIGVMKRKVELLQRDEGVVDIKLFPNGDGTTPEQAAADFLALMNAGIVKDNGLF
jgi:hypothetical protein